MGWEVIDHEGLARSIERDLAKHLNGNIVVRKKGKTYHILMQFNRNAPLSKVVEAIRRFQQMAEDTATPTKIVVKIPRDSKMHTLTIPTATVGYRRGRPEFPKFGVVGKALYIAPDYPRAGSPNIREVVGQYLGAFLARHMAHIKEGLTFTASDVGVEIARRKGGKKAIEQESDIDLFHLRVVELRDGTHYELIPVEVTTSAERIPHKIGIWKRMAKVLEKMAAAEGKKLHVKPIVIYVKTPGNKGKNAEKQIELALRKHFGEYHVVSIKSTSKSDGKYITTTGRYGHVEYIAGALKNIAELPEKYHTDLTSVLLKHYNNLSKLEEIFEDIAALRKIWRARKIPEAAKHYITDRYAEHITAGRENALEKAIEDSKNRYVELQPVVERKAKEVMETRRRRIKTHPPE